MLITKEEFNELIKNAINCLVIGIKTRYRLKDGSIVINYGGTCFMEEK